MRSKFLLPEYLLEGNHKSIKIIIKSVALVIYLLTLMLYKLNLHLTKAKNF